MPLNSDGMTENLLFDKLKKMKWSGEKPALKWSETMRENSPSSVGSADKKLPDIDGEEIFQNTTSYHKRQWKHSGHKC